MKSLTLFLFILLFSIMALPLTADAADPPNADTSEQEQKAKEEPPPLDFEHEEAYMDIQEALRSRHYVHRAILSSIIKETAKVNLGSWYFFNSLGFNAVYQPSNQGGKSFAKYTTGVMGFALGKSTAGGHTFELGFDYSGVSNLSLSYRLWFKTTNSTFWPFLGGGVGTEIGFRLAEVPIEAQVYQGIQQMIYLSAGALIPMVDLAIRMEAKFNFFQVDRLMLTTAVGVVFFI